MTILATILAVLVFANPASASESPAPLVAHHQHLFDPDLAALIKVPTITADDLIADLDRAGIKRGVVLSTAYSFADERKAVPNARAHVEAANAWTAGEVARSKGRLIGFCGVNPLTDYAVAEIERCTRLPGMRGLKLHLGNAGVSLRQPAHVSQMRDIFAAANRLRAPIVVHMRARTGTPYGAEDATIFLNEVLPAAPDIVVQVAHFAGAGPGFPENAQAAMAVLAHAVANKDPRARNLYFDVTTIVTGETAPENAAAIARYVREVGPGRVLFGSDAPLGGNPKPLEAWQIFTKHLPLTDDEFRTIAANVAPYAR
jgi:predicted TIM-barrel fold metal-dependent hydrolase